MIESKNLGNFRAVSGGIEAQVLLSQSLYGGLCENRVVVGFDYDIIVHGGGAAGLTAAGYSSLFRARTALIESGRLGGDCTWTGCVPSKTLLKAAKVAHQMRTADRYGLKSQTPEIDFAALMEHVRQVQEGIYQDADAPPNMEKLGVTVAPGQARFIGPHRVEVTGPAGTHSVSASKFVIATGPSPRSRICRDWSKSLLSPTKQSFPSTPFPSASRSWEQAR